MQFYQFLIKIHVYAVIIIIHFYDNFAIPIYLPLKSKPFL